MSTDTRGSRGTPCFFLGLTFPDSEAAQPPWPNDGLCVVTIQVLLVLRPTARSTVHWPQWYPCTLQCENYRCGLLRSPAITQAQSRWQGHKSSKSRDEGCFKCLFFLRPLPHSAALQSHLPRAQLSRALPNWGLNSHSLHLRDLFGVFCFLYFHVLIWNWRSSTAYQTCNLGQMTSSLWGFLFTFSLVK